MHLVALTLRAPDLQSYVNRCNVLKLPPRATLARSIFNSTKLPHPEV